MSKTIKFPGKAEHAKPILTPATLQGQITKLQSLKGGKVQIVIEAEIDDPVQTELKRLLDLQHGPVSIHFEEVAL